MLLLLQPPRPVHGCFFVLDNHRLCVTDELFGQADTVLPYVVSQPGGAEIGPVGGLQIAVVMRTLSGRRGASTSHTMASRSRRLETPAIDGPSSCYRSRCRGHARGSSSDCEQEASPRRRHDVPPGERPEHHSNRGRRGSCVAGPPLYLGARLALGVLRPNRIARSVPRTAARASTSSSRNPSRLPQAFTPLCASRKVFSDEFERPVIRGR
jgi:hypothetical protein